MTLSLIPPGQPHGDRQENEAAAQEAGLPTRISQQAPTQIEAPLRQATPRAAGEFDALQSRTPTSSGQLRQNQDARILDSLATSPSPILRDLSERLRGF